MNHKIRRAAPDDAVALVTLFAEHATFEKASFSEDDKSERLHTLLGNAESSFHCFVVEDGQGVQGYLTCFQQFSTWDMQPYLYLDCLFLREGLRGQGIGRHFMELLQELAQAESCSLIQWQTPVFNESAIRFYKREGAIGLEKMRFFIEVE